MLAIKSLTRGAAASLAVLMIGAAGQASAARIAPDKFALGQSAQSGAVCQAVRNDDAPGAQARGARAWDVTCRGWDAPLGVLYAYSYQPQKTLAAGGVWQASLAKAKIRCEAAKPVKVTGVTGSARADCKAFQSGVGYVAYSGAVEGRGVAAQGFPQMADVLEAGLRVIGGAAPPPKPTQSLPAATASAGGESLIAVANAAAQSPEKLRDHGYSRNMTWNFSDAETDFRALAQDTGAPDRLRAEAYLNWALNTSNNGNFDRAKGLFERADELAAGDPVLKGLSLSYKALDYRNQRKFKESTAAAEDARETYIALQIVNKDVPLGEGLKKEPGSDLVISPEVAAKLRGPSSLFDSSTVDTASRILVRIAQVDLTEATSLEALSRSDEARARLVEAREILAEPTIAGVEPWLAAQLDAELARQDLAQGHAAEAQTRLNNALTQLRQRQAGSQAEAFLLIEIARVDAAMGRQDQALQEYQAGIGLFRETRGSLGSSADSITPYLDMLIARSKADPAHVADYDGQFMTAVESIGSLTTAQVVAKLSAKLAQSDRVSAGLIRAYEDTRRQARAKEAEIAQLQSQNAYTPAMKAKYEPQLKALHDQEIELFSKVVATDPKYGQRITTDVSLKDLQAALKPGELYLKVALLTAQGYGIAVTADGATPYKVDLGRASAGAAVAKLRKAFDAEVYVPRYDVAGAYQLYRRLFGPVQDEVIKAKRIIYEPNSILLPLPIAALVTDQASVDMMAKRRKIARAKGDGDASYDGVHWLGRSAETSLVVSAASFVQARKFSASAGRHAFLGLGDPELPSSDNAKAFTSVANLEGADAALCQETREALFAMQPLKETGRELKEVGDSINPNDATIVTGEAFNDGAVEQRNDLDQYRVLFFATHGLLPTKRDCLPEPALLTSVGEEQSDGLLTASKIAGLSLDADLVVLSACDTGGGLEAGVQDKTGLAGSGEALSGLTRAFIYAGARSLIVSHWSVDVHAMVELMTATFSSGAPTQSGALRDADLKLMGSEKYSHPYYWAAFTLVGDGARPMPAREASTKVATPGATGH
jgi:CHAT domain-containing protein